MTLVVFVRCKDGCILAADRKATSQSGFGQEEAKCEISEDGWAVAGSGNNGSVILKLFADLKDGISVKNVEQSVTDRLNEYLQSIKFSAECIVIAARNETVDALIVQASDVGAFPSQITAPFRCIGEMTPRIVAEHYIKRRMRETEFTSRSCVEVAPEILAILRWACGEGSYVGSQEEYGLDLILLQKDGFCFVSRVTSEWAMLKIDYALLSGFSSQLKFQPFSRKA